jgi:thiol-disulfide isomerase/thioredoxin
MISASIRTSPTRALLLFAALLTTTPDATVAQGAAKDPRYVASGAYLLLLDGKRVESEFFYSAGTGSILFKSPELESWVELHPRGRLIAIYDSSAFHRNADGTYDKLSSPLPKPGGAFELVGNLPKFTVEGRVVTLERRPDLLGPQTAESIMEQDPSYRVRANAYAPTNVDFLERVKSLKEPLLVKVYFGSWCSTCVELLPNVFKVQELIEGSGLRFEYYGIPNDNYNDPEARRLQVKVTPTAILYSGAEEIGRIVGHTWRFPEVALHNALVAAGKL